MRSGLTSSGVTNFSKVVIAYRLCHLVTEVDVTYATSQ